MGVGLFTTPSPTCGISGLLVVDSHAVLQAHQGRGRFGDRHRPLHRPTHVARERTSKASTGRACLPHCVAHTAAHIAPHEWAKVHTGTRNRGCVTAACGCRDIEMSAACTCPCRRSSTAGCMAGQPPLLKDSRVRPKSNLELVLRARAHTFEACGGSGAGRVPVMGATRDWNPLPPPLTLA